MAQAFDDVACMVCGCVCDDLQIEVENGRILRAAGACRLAEPWFLNQNTRQPPPAEIEGQSAPYERAVERAAAILKTARSPLICGLTRSSTEGHRAALRLADQLGAVIDPAGSARRAAATMALQEVGASTCTLGEVRHRADLVIFWGSNPVQSHPRHLERYSLWPEGRFITSGRAGRTLIVVDSQQTATAELADEFIQIETGRQFESLWTLRALIRDLRLAESASSCVPGPALASLARHMKSCRCGVVFFGPGLASQGIAHRNVEALLQLVTELNAYTRFYAMPMQPNGSAAGAEAVLSWQTGYPCGVNLSRGYPRYNPGEYTADEMLRRQEADACLIIGSEAISELSPQAAAHLNRIPTIALDAPAIASQTTPTVRFTTSVNGIHQPGTAYRMDEVPIPLRAMLPKVYPSDAEVLDAVAGTIRDA